VALATVTALAAVGPMPASALTAAAVPAALPAAAPTPPGTPAGWRLVRTDDFGGSRLSGIWGTYGGPHGGAAASYYSEDQVVVSGGLLRLRIADRPSGGRRYATGGVGGWNLTQTYGRYEFRARAPRGRGMDAYVTLWPQSQAPQQAALIEILARPGAEKAYLSNEYGSGETNRTVGGRFSDRFHTYAIEWAPRSFRILIDGEVRLSDTRVSRERRWLGFALSSGDPLTGLPDGATRIPNEFQVDWVRFFAYDPTAKGAPAAGKPTPSARPASPAPPRPASPSPDVPPASATPTTPAASAGAGQRPATGTEVDAAGASEPSAARRLLPAAGAALLLAGGAALAFPILGRGRRSRPPRHGR
jgi:licheninase